MHNVQLGKPIVKEDPQRDAVHVPIIQVESEVVVYPGQKIGMVKDGKVSPHAAVKHGIVDPFQDSPIYPGTRFFMCFPPGQITSLTHAWEHPDFPVTASGSTPSRK